MEDKINQIKTGTFTPFVPNYGFNSWQGLNDETDKEIGDILIDRQERNLMLSKDFTTTLSEDIRIDTKNPLISAKLKKIESYIESVNPKLTIHESPMGLDVWGQVNFKGGATAMHKHENFFAFVYYVSAPKNCGMLNFYVNYDTKHEICKADPATGTLLFFPAWVPHFTMRNNSEEPRIVISGNVHFEDRNAK